MSTAVERDLTISKLATMLEETLTDGVAAFREGETRTTFNKVDQIADARHTALITNGYVYPSGRYKGTLREIDESKKAYPGTSSQALSSLAHTALQEVGRAIFLQTSTDTKTNQDIKALSRAAAILDLEILRLGYEHADRDTFEAVRTTLNRPNIFRTTTRCR